MRAALALMDPMSALRGAAAHGRSKPLWRAARAFRPVAAALLCAALSSGLALAQPREPQPSATLVPGEYIGGGGFLRIGPAAGGVQKFEIATDNGRGFSCAASGALRGGRATLQGEGRKPCVIDFTPDQEGITSSVESEPGTCAGFCGMNGSLDASFAKPVPGCSLAQMKQTRADFKRQYDARAYGAARGLLAPLLARCGKLLTEDDDLWVRNDLAITYYRLGRGAECRKVLEPLQDMAATSDDELTAPLIRGEHERVLRGARATRTNLKLCGAPAK
jgi:hypothetical protein